MRLKVSHFLALVVVTSLSIGLLAGPADARSHRMSAKQKAHVRAKLRKQVKKNPKVVQRKSFLKQASLVNFTLPVTLRLRGTAPVGPVNGNYCPSPATTVPCVGSNPNAASIDLGSSLGQRQIGLGGSLSGNIRFHDSYDGGALGNVDLELKPSANHKLTTTSIPLLWNTQVSTGRYDANDLAFGDQTGASGCSDWKSGGNLTAIPTYGGNGTSVAFGAGSLQFAQGVLNSGAGLPGYPYFHDGAAATAGDPNGFLQIKPGVDVINNVTTGSTPGNNNIVGPTANPFPAGVNPDYTSGNLPPNTYQPTAQDTVLRTNALSLDIAGPGTSVAQDNPNGNGPSGSQDIVIGKSGGQANLFGNIPGKSTGIDITASFSTPINSIIRMVDQDSFHTKLISGGNWPAGVFNCAQVWTGSVQNYIPGVHLTGSLKIAPGLTYDGHLRIAKATVSTPSVGGTPDVARFAVAACLAPESNYKDAYGTLPNQTDQNHPRIPDPGTGLASAGTNPPTPGGAALTSILSEPLNPDAPRGAPSDACNTAETDLVRFSALTTTVPFLAPAVPADGYNTTADGSKVSVAADLNVQNVAVDVLIGDV